MATVKIRPRYVKPRPKRKISKSEKILRKVAHILTCLVLLAGIVVAVMHLVNKHLNHWCGIKTFIIFTAMKFASIILSFILLVLSCLPCADADKDAVYDANGKVLAEKHFDHSKELHSDLCSPFCVCNCCGAQVLSFTPSLSFSIREDFTAFVEKPEIVYKTHFASMFSGSIWQPPQIV